jgi:hypothetical protein
MLPEVVTATDVANVAVEAGQVVVGLDDVLARPVVVDFNVCPTLAVMGPDLSGRTSCVRRINQAIRGVFPTSGVWSVYVSGRGIAPPDHHSWDAVALDLPSATQAVTRTAGAVTGRPAGQRTLVVVDDADELLEVPIGAPADQAELHRQFAAAMETLVNAPRNCGVAVMIAGRLHALTRATTWALRIRHNAQFVLLAPASLATTFTDPVSGITLPRRSDFRPSAGDGVLLQRGQATVIRLVQP